MFRDENGYGVYLNLTAVHCYREGASLIADAEMSTHVHKVVLAGNPMRLDAGIRHSYTKYFNRKYGRKGRMGEKGLFLMELSGYYHIGTAISYVCRNGLHHGASPTSFGYPFCSVNALYMKDRGFREDAPFYVRRSEIAGFLPRYSVFPDRYVMNEQGVFLRSSFMELQTAESYYGTARNYLYQMNRLTSDEWIADQQKDREESTPVTLDRLEPEMVPLSEYLANEFGKRYRPDKPTDLDVCKLIDKHYARAAGCGSVYQLPDSLKERIFRELKYEHHLPEDQIRRCLVV